MLLVDPSTCNHFCNLTFFLGDEQQIPGRSEHADWPDNEEPWQDGEDQIRDVDHRPHASEGHIRHAVQAEHQVRKSLFLLNEVVYETK